MLMKPENKSLAGLILSNAVPKDESMKKDNEAMMEQGATHGDMASEDNESSEDEVGLQAASEELMEAFQSGDSKALMEALKAFMELYKK